MPLSDTKARAARPRDKSYKLTDDQGLYLDVLPSGRKVWRYRFWLDGSDGRYTIGEYPAISLQEARKLRDEARVMCQQGINPSKRKKDEKKASSDERGRFGWVAQQWIAENSPRWSPQYLAKTQSVLSSDILPAIGEMPIRAITSAHVLSIINAAKQRGSPTIAAKSRQICSAIFCYAIPNLWADYDVAAPIRGAIARRQTEHARCLSDAELKSIFKNLASHGSRQMVIAIELLAMLFVRTTELRAAEWSEFDMDSALWVIPAERMKKRRAHSIPLPSQAMALLHELRMINGEGRYLFPSRQSKAGCMGQTSINTTLSKLGIDNVSGHDFRATASTWLLEADFEESWVEMQLAHQTKNKTTAAYNHARYLSQRRVMLQWWADKLCEIKASAIHAATD